jgi:hypothetical protein
MSKRKREKIIRELPAIGTALIGKFMGKSYQAEIVKDESSPKKRAILYKGKLFPSMTAAAIAITKQPTNGWRFWKFPK